jgi:hypothetical protein
LNHRFAALAMIATGKGILNEIMVRQGLRICDPGRHLLKLAALFAPPVALVFEAGGNGKRSQQRNRGEH